MRKHCLFTFCFNKSHDFSIGATGQERDMVFGFSIPWIIIGFKFMNVDQDEEMGQPGTINSACDYTWRMYNIHLQYKFKHYYLLLLFWIYMVLNTSLDFDLLNLSW